MPPALNARQWSALRELSRYRPHAVPPPQNRDERNALQGLARRGLCFSLTVHGARRFQLSPEGEELLEGLGELGTKYSRGTVRRRG